MKKNLCLIFSLFLFLGCSDLFMKEAQKEEETFSRFITCELDVKALSYIFEENIKSDILCLKENLHLFMDTVETDRPGYISKKVLKNFVKNGPLEVDENIAGIIDSVFDLSHLIIGSEKEYIIRENVDVLLDFLIFFNEHVWKSYKLFRSSDDVNFSRHLKEREIVYNELSMISQRLSEIYKPERPEINSIDSERFLLNFFQSDHEVLEKVRSLMFLKKVFLGGQEWVLTHNEFFNALTTLPSLGQVAFDLAKMKNYKFANRQESLIKVFLRDIDVVKEHLFFAEDSHEAVFTVYDAINAIVTVTPDMLSIDVSKYSKEIMKVKEIFLGTGGELISAKELIVALEHGKNILEEADLFYRIYDFFKEELDSQAPVTHDFSGFSVNNSKEELIREKFSRIVHDYKFLKGSFLSPFYTFDYYRNANAYFQTGALEYGVKLVMAHYGQKNLEARGDVDMTLDDSVKMIDDFKWFLKDHGIISVGRKGGGEIAAIADNLVLMSTLFQYQSDGCDAESACMEAPELTEFLTGLLTAVSMRDFFTETMTQLCRDELDQFDRIAPDCFRRNFINIVETKIDGSGKAISDYMPFLHSYLKELVASLPEGTAITESPSFMKFMSETESFTRSCMYYDEDKTEEVYMRANDAFAVFAGLLNVESTLLRFDIDQNNNVDAFNSVGYNEVLNAYNSTYKGALIGMVTEQVGSQFLGRMLAKPIFQYLIKFGKIPEVKEFKSIWRFAKFILSKNKNADISRTTVATVLKTIGQQSPNAEAHPFKCEECFRDPTVECLPEGDPWE